MPWMIHKKHVVRDGHSGEPEPLCTLTSLFSYATLFGFLFTLARVSCVFAFPAAGRVSSAPEAAKIVLSLAHSR
jgi:hypothetical protein